MLVHRINGLDGIRGISILMVLLSHGGVSLPVSITDNFIYRIFSNGGTGVMIFFVISGYLITKLLLIEQEQKGKISIRNFYIRRFFRIFPVFYLYIAVVVLLKNTVFPDIFSDYTTVLLSALYLWNYNHLLTDPLYEETNGYWFMGHLWSLSMEEQFYVIWPLAFKKITIRTLTNAVIVIIAAMPVLRMATYYYIPDSRGQISMMLHTGGDTILIGCLGALLERSEKFMSFLKYLYSKAWLVIAAFVYVAIVHVYLHEQFGGAYILPIGHSLVNFVILFLILWCMYVPSVISRFLNFRWITQVGILSYSLYIWQQLIFTDSYNLVINSFPLNFITVFTIAFTSYYFIERPVLKLRTKFRT